MINQLKGLTRHRSEAQDRILRNCSEIEMDIYNKIYLEYIDPSFRLNKWCSDCVGNMVQRVWRWVSEMEAQGKIKDFEFVIEEPIVVKDEEQPKQKPKKK